VRAKSPFWLIPIFTLVSSSATCAQAPDPGLVDRPIRIAQPVGEEAFWALAQFFDYDGGLRLSARVVEKTEEKTYTREKIVFTGVHGDRVPGYFAYPTTGDGPYPVVLFLHGFANSKEGPWRDDDFERGGLLTKGLLKSGFATLALDAQYHGERIAHNDYQHPGAIVVGRQLAKYRELYTQTVIEYRLALDYLATRTVADTSRSGVIGYSMGGMMAFTLTAVEPRIKAAVACVAPPMGEGLLKVMYGEAPPDRLRALTSSPQARTNVTAAQNYAPAIDSQPFLMLMGRRDGLYSIQEAQQLYDLIPSPVKELELYDSDHRLPPEYAARAVRWFVEHLK